MLLNTYSSTDLLLKSDKTEQIVWWLAHDTFSKKYKAVFNFTVHCFKKITA